MALASEAAKHPSRTTDGPPFFKSGQKGGIKEDIFDSQKCTPRPSVTNRAAIGALREFGRSQMPRLAQQLAGSPFAGARAK